MNEKQSELAGEGGIVPMESIDEFRAFVAAHGWRFAKSMPECPHEYVVRRECRSRGEFLAAAQHIRKHGTVKPWGRFRHTYLEVDGHNYWTMGAPLAETTILNRQLVEDFEKGMPA